MAQLAYPYQSQLLSEWCWCAAAGSIAGFHRNGPAVPQCQVADLVFRSASCEGGRPNPDRNVPQSLDVPLRKLKNHKNIVTGRLGFDQLVGEVDQGRPIGVRIQWTDQPGVGHLVVISGYDRPTSMVMVEDPKFGRRMFSYEAMSRMYLGRGFWSFTYLTRRQPNA